MSNHLTKRLQAFIIHFWIQSSLQKIFERETESCFVNNVLLYHIIAAALI